MEEEVRLANADVEPKAVCPKDGARALGADVDEGKAADVLLNALVTGTVDPPNGDTEAELLVSNAELFLSPRPANGDMLEGFELPKEEVPVVKVAPPNTFGVVFRLEKAVATGAGACVVKAGAAAGADVEVGMEENAEVGPLEVCPKTDDAGFGPKLSVSHSVALGFTGDLACGGSS